MATKSYCENAEHQIKSEKCHDIYGGLEAYYSIGGRGRGKRERDDSFLLLLLFWCLVTSGLKLLLSEKKSEGHAGGGEGYF